MAPAIEEDAGNEKEEARCCCGDKADEEGYPERMDGTYAALLGAFIGAFFGAAGVVLGALIVQRGENRRHRSALALQMALHHYERFCRDLDSPPEEGEVIAPGMLEVFYQESLNVLERGRLSGLSADMWNERMYKTYCEAIREQRKRGKNGHKG